MKMKKSIVGLLSMVVCFVLMFDVVYAGIDDEVSIYPFDLGFEITSYATSVEPSDTEAGLTYNLLSSSDQAYVYFHRNINQDLTSFNGIYFDIHNPSFDALNLSLTLSPGIGSISSVAPTTDVGKITYLEDEEKDGFFDDDFWHKDNHGGDGHYDKEVEDDDDDEDEDGSNANLGISIIPDYSYFVTATTSTYFTANTARDGKITIPAGFNGRIYIPFFSLGLGGELNDFILNNVSSIGFTVVSTNGLSQAFILNSYGKYSYNNNQLLEQAKTAKIVGADELSIPSVGINSTQQLVQGVPSDIEYRYEVVSNDSFIVILDLDDEVVGAFPRALEGFFNVRVWISDVVCLDKVVILNKSNEGISSVVSESSVTDGAYISFFVYVRQLIDYYRFYFLIIPMIFAFIILVILASNVEKKKKDNGGFE